MTDDFASRDSHDERFNRVLAEWLDAAARGGALDRQAVLAAHPEFAQELAAFLDDHAAMERLAGPEREALAGRASTVGVEDTAVRSVDGAVRELGDYEIQDEIARGGMGVVYRALHKSLQRVVALKTLGAGAMATAELRARFHQEAEAVARLAHPNIVPIYEVGRSGETRYFTMKWVEGGSLATRLPELQNDPRRVARLVADVARAIQFAHERGVLHRDLKPANILLDADDVPLVADFGLARLVDATSEMTRTGVAVGTPGYMAPEQIRGEKLVTTAADVYSLGAVLFACLAGRPPFFAESPWEAMRQAAENDAPSLRALNPKIDADLETICQKALQREPTRRYASAGALADDLERWLRDEPLVARPPTCWQRAIKWIRRHPAWSSAIALATIALAGLLAQGEFARRTLLRERAANQRADGLLYRVLMALAEREWAAGATFGAREALLQCAPARRGWEWNYVKRLCYATPGHALGDFPEQLVDGGFSGDGARLFVIDRTGLARAYDGATRRELGRWQIEPAEGRTVGAMSHDGRRLALATKSGLRLVDVDRPDESEPLWTCEALPHFAQLGFTPDGGAVAVLTGRASAAPSAVEFALVRVADGNVLAREEIAPAVAWQSFGWFRFTKTDRVLVSRFERSTATAQTSLSVFDATTGARLDDLPLPPRDGSWYGPIAVDAREERFAYVRDIGDKRLEVVDREGGVVLSQSWLWGAPFSCEFSSDSRRLLFLTLDLNVDVEDARLHEALPTFGPLIGVLGKRQPNLLHARVVDLRRGQEVADLLGLQGTSAGVRFSPDGETILAFGGAVAELARRVERGFGEARLWRAAAGETARTLRLTSRDVREVAVSSDGRFVAAGDRAGVVRVFELASGALFRELRGHDQPVVSVAFGDDPDMLLTATEGDVRLWHVTTGETSRKWGPGANEYWSVVNAALRADGRQVAISRADRGGFVAGFSLEGAEEFRVAGAAQFVSYSRDGRWLAVPYQFDLHGELALIDVATGREAWRVKTEQKLEFFRLGWGYLRATFSPDGSTLAAVGNVGGAHLYDVRTGKLLRQIAGHDTTTWDAAFTSDGSRLATSGYVDGIVKIWSTETGDEMHALRGHATSVTGVKFTRDDVRLVSADISGGLRIWEAGPVDADRREPEATGGKEK